MLEVRLVWQVTALIKDAVGLLMNTAPGMNLFIHDILLCMRPELKMPKFIDQMC